MKNYYWETEEPLSTTAETMQNFIDYHLFEVFKAEADITFANGSYMEIIDRGVKYAVEACGDGDFINHVAKFEVLSEEGQQFPKEGLLYRHFKGGSYTVLHIALDTETEKQTVVYRSVTDGKIFTRPLNIWLEDVSYENTIVKRFKKYGEI